MVNLSIFELISDVGRVQLYSIRRMELIEALKQLSLEVRNQEHGSISDDLSSLIKTQVNHAREKSPRFSGEDQTRSGGNLNWQYPSTVTRQYQLQEFDYSIDTLFTQISDLEQSKPYQDLSLSDYKVQPRGTLLAQRRFMGRLESSQEEDSDCSSQQSGHDRNSIDINPLVEDLLRKDLSTITDTVKKISQIITIGSKIEIVWNSLTSNRDFRHKTMKQDEEYTIDVHHIKTMCDTFASLLADEPHIRGLPTIVRFNDYCSKLNHMFPNFTSTVNSEITSDDDNIMEESNSFVYPQNSVVIPSSEESDADVSSSLCSKVGNWTVNKLYINNRPH